jgi:hypothetical protein
MDKKAIDRAQAALHECTASILEMEAAKSFSELEKYWSSFLVSANRIYTRLEQGAKANGKSTSWFGRKQHERKNDKLLMYVRHARNVDEHNLEEITEREPSSLKLGVGPGAWRFDGTLGSGGTMKVTALGGQVPGVSKFVEFTPAKVRMIKVVDRGVPYDPPLDSSGNEIQPLEAAKLALGHLSNIIEEARKLAS